MQTIPPDVTHHDVWQWLNNGWFWYQDRDGTVPARLDQDGPEHFIVSCADGTEKPYRRSLCFPHWPDCGAVNLQGFAIIVERQQIRQYRRTYNHRCVDIDVPRKWDVMKLHPWVRSISGDHPEVVVAVFTPNYYPYTRALELLESGWVSVALNPYLIVAGKREDHVVYYRSKMAGRVVNGKLIPLDPNNPRSRRILKWFDGRVQYEDSRLRA